jgi:type I site-specific restriction endonuclease
MGKGDEAVRQCQGDISRLQPAQYQELWLYWTPANGKRPILKGGMDKRTLSERDICTKFITPSLVAAGWNVDTQLREEVGFTDGRIYVRGKLQARGAQKRADYILYFKPNIPIAVVEVKDNSHTVSAGIQQALAYAKTLDIPFVFSSNGDAFFFHDGTVVSGLIETEIPLTAFPSPDQLWQKYRVFKGITDEVESVVAQDYFSDGSNRSPRYYQQIAINRTVEAIARHDGDNRHLLVMATGTGKTYTAFQIIYRLWKSGVKKRILFLADRTALIDQTVRGDRHFKEAMTVIKHKQIDTAYNIYLSLYQGLADNNDEDAYKQFSPEFFDLIIVDECHRGSAREDSKWREILNAAMAPLLIWIIRSRSIPAGERTTRRPRPRTHRRDRNRESVRMNTEGMAPTLRDAQTRLNALDLWRLIFGGRLDTLAADLLALATRFYGLA